MSIPLFIVKYQNHLMSAPEGVDTESGRAWYFESPQGEVIITEFHGAFGQEYIISYPTEEDPRDVYGIDYDPVLHGDKVYTDESSEDPHAIDQALNALLRGGVEMIDFRAIFPQMNVHQENADWILEPKEVPDTSFILREGAEGYNIVFIGPEDITAKGGPFQEIPQIGKFVEDVIRSLTQSAKPDVSASPVEKVESAKVSLLKSAMKKVSDACSEIDQTEMFQFSDALTLVLGAIQKTINQMEEKN